MWSEKYRPNDLSQYIGNHQSKQIVKNYVESVIKGKPNVRGLILYGPHGTGKTSLIFALRESYSIPIVYTNASDERRKDEIEQVTLRGVTKPFGKKTSLTVLDEAEKIQGDLEAAIEHTNIILIVNDKYKIDKKIRHQLREVEFSSPTIRSKRKYAERIIAEEDIFIPHDIKQRVIRDSRSFRRVAINLQMALAGQKYGFQMNTYDLGLFEEVKSILEGERKGRSDINPDDLLMWALDNGGNPAMVSKLDRILGKSKDYRGWKYVYDLAKYTKVDTEDIDYPRFIRLLGKFKGGSK